MIEYSTAMTKPTVAMYNNLDESYNVEQKKPGQCTYTGLIPIYIKLKNRQN